jgi:hypothetical protein
MAPRAACVIVRLVAPCHCVPVNFDVRAHHMATFNATSIGAVTVFGQATGKSRFNLALHHLFAASRFTAAVTALETQNQGQPFGAFWEEILHNALGVVSLTVASLESYANEFHFEGSALAAALPSKAADVIAAMIDREAILAKFDVTLAIRKDKRLDFGQNHVQNVDTLIKLRNAVLHFRPEWFGEQDKHKTLSNQLAYKFSGSPFLPNEPLFPRAWASASFCAWALGATVTFMDRFCAEAELQNPVTQFFDRVRELSNNAL